MRTATDRKTEVRFPAREGISLLATTTPIHPPVKTYISGPFPTDKEVAA